MRTTNRPADGVGGEGPAGRRPLHPAVNHIPIGGVVAAAIFDAVSAIAGSEHALSRDLYRAGTFVLMVANGFMLVVIATGLLDRGRATTKGTTTRARVNQHAWTMAAIVPVLALEIILRRQKYPSALHTPTAPLLLTLLALVVVIVGAELGGRLTYRDGLNVAARTSTPDAARRGSP